MTEKIQSGLDLLIRELKTEVEGKRIPKRRRLDLYHSFMNRAETHIANCGGRYSEYGDRIAAAFARILRL